MIFEDFLDNLENLIKFYMKKMEDLDELPKKILRMWKEVEDFEKTEDLERKIELTVRYYSKLSSLPLTRVMKRLENGREIIKKLREEFLISCCQEENFNCLNPSGRSILESPIKFARKVGPGREKILKKLGLSSIRDLIMYFPRDYDDRRRIIPLNLLREGERAVVLGKLLKVEKRKFGDTAIHAGVVHARDRQGGIDLLQKVISNFNCQEAVLSEISISLAAHFGPGALGITAYPVK